MRHEPLSELRLYVIHESQLVIGKKNGEERLEAKQRKQADAHTDDECLVRVYARPPVQGPYVIHVCDSAWILQDGDIREQDPDAEDLEEPSHHNENHQYAQLCSFGDGKEAIYGSY